MPTIDQRVAALAAANHGIFTDHAALRLGATPAAIRHRRQTGRWERVAPGVLRVGGAPPTFEQSLAIAVASLGPATVVSHRAAAAMWGFDDFPKDWVELTVPRRQHNRRGPWILHTSEVLPRIDIVRHLGFRLTTASRTIVDLAALAPRPARLGDAIDSAIRDGRSSPTVLRRRIGALRGSGRAGVRLLDALMLDSGGHSRLERVFLRTIREAGLPRPRTQVIHRRGGITIARVDFEWADRWLIVEVSGQRGHASEAERAKDARRQNELQAEGFTVFEFTTSHVLTDPGYVVATLRPHLLPDSFPRSGRRTTESGK